MSTPLHPLKLWGQGGPNPPKITLLLTELHLPYEITPIPPSEVKSPSYTAINPNGRLPSLYDPNTNLTIWESGAIIEYLIETYDTAHKLSFPPGSPESYHAKQWLYFASSGQGPYYGQAVWFQKLHAEKLPSAVERYVKEINRVTGVLEGWLAKQALEREGNDSADGPYLVGNKFSYADLAFVPWQRIAGIVFGGGKGYEEDEFPFVKDWMRRMMAREGWKEVLEVAMGPVRKL